MEVPAAAALAPSPLPPQPAPAPAPDTTVASAAPSAAPSPTSGPVPVHSTVGAAPQSAPASNQQTDTTLSPVVAKLFNAAEQNVQVSFQVLTNPDEVVTVFTDKSTGKEIIQFPSQALIALAEMYDKNAGKVLDKSV
jgi:hypothetical protein